MYLTLNRTGNRRFGYYYDQRLAGPPSHRLFRRAGILATLALLCMAWVPVDNLLTSRSQALHAREKARFVADVQANFAEVKNLHALIVTHGRLLSRAQSWKLAETIQILSQRYDLDPYLILAVIKTESYFDPDAISVAGAEGLMQILPAVGEELSDELRLAYLPGETLFEPIANVRLGVHFLSYLLDRFGGDIETALLAYNRGPNDVARARSLDEDVPRHYAERVLAYYKAFRGERDQASIRDGDVLPYRYSLLAKSRPVL